MMDDQEYAITPWENLAALLHSVFLGIVTPLGVDGNLTLVNMLQLEGYVLPERYYFSKLE